MMTSVTEILDGVIDPENYNYSVPGGVRKHYGEGRIALSKRVREILPISRDAKMEQTVVFLKDGRTAVLLTFPDEPVKLKD